MRAPALLLALAACGGEAPPEAPMEAPVEAPAEAPEAAIDRSDVVMGLVQAPGRDQVLANCVACHSTALITQNRMSRERWDATLTWMQETQGLWPIAAPDRARILDYLALTQGPEAEGAVGGPWAQPTYPPNPLW